MLKCHGATRMIASGEVDELGFWKRLELRMHLAMCRHCQNYARQIKALGEGARRLVGGRAPTDSELQKLEDEICHRICSDGGHSH